jgi:hypothetical protein
MRITEPKYVENVFFFLMMASGIMMAASWSMDSMEHGAWSMEHGACKAFFFKRP